MLNRILSTAIIATIVAFAPALAAEKDSDQAMSGKMHSQAACPVSGKDISKTVYADYDGKRVYFCCADCKAAFEKDPAKYIKKLKADGVKLEMVTHPQSACPFTGKDINKMTYSDYDGQRVYFCCPNCKAAFEKAPQKTIDKLNAEGVSLEKVAHKQSLCPVMGGEINTSLFSDYEGKRVYFCCPMCKPEFEKDPAKYIQAMEDKGIQLDKSPTGA
jgi:YHS domain-containing protein